MRDQFYAVNQAYGEPSSNHGSTGRRHGERIEARALLNQALQPLE